MKTNSPNKGVTAIPRYSYPKGGIIDSVLSDGRIAELSDVNDVTI
jgi:hypothetical protein